MALNTDINNELNLEQIIKCIQSGCAPEVSADENHLADRDEALLAHLNLAKSILNKLNILLSKFLNNDVDLQIKLQDIIYPCLYLCGEHCKSDLLWSDEESHTLMKLCIEKLCSLMHYINIDELITHLDVSKIFFGLQCKLENDKWKKYPAAVECFIWILKYLKMPFLNSILYLVMPLPLNMFDDYQDSSILTALDAFHHIIDNTPSVELTMSGYDIVLLKSLETGLRSFEYQLIPNVMKCLLSLISKMQMKHLSNKNSLEWTKFDDVMNILLPRMELERKHEPIVCYASIFPLVLESTGFSCIRWSERLIPLFTEYVMNSQSTFSTVKAIEVFIQQTWPRRCTHWNVLLLILIKALYNEDKNSMEPNEKNILVIVECIKTLEAARPECVRNVLNKLKQCEEFQSKIKFKKFLDML
ncbi:TELO2-interacting protein 2-like [Melanaphis sacchari]|uniref:TELO2-interacting protein 2 n=1 Tax=Melanaphis sacchari TaxID=742174 RepID=A0A2H8TN58_9HEMI|nr:TELO2-interacting protein 2-like [Melanaphis sacchari]XP_025198706.1 TELO2-interacting protein 2-like [Melanaphis sacchari]